MEFVDSSTYRAVGSDQHRVCLTRLRDAFRLSQPLDVSFRPQPPRLVSCGSVHELRAFRGFPLTTATAASRQQLSFMPSRLGRTEVHHRSVHIGTLNDELQGFEPAARSVSTPSSVTRSEGPLLSWPLPLQGSPISASAPCFHGSLLLWAWSCTHAPPKWVVDAYWLSRVLKS